MQAEMQAVVRKNMIEELKDQHLIDKLVPSWDVWCRRVTPCTSFIEAIHEPHVRIVTDHVKTITAAGVDTEAGDSYPIDRIILATGFDTSFKPKYEIRGTTGKTLAETWEDRPKGT